MTGRAAPLVLLALAAARVAAQPLGGDFRVNVSTTGDQVHSAVAISGSPTGGTFMVVWQEGYNQGTNTNISARTFDLATGAPMSTPFLVNSYTTGDQRAPRVAAAQGGLLTTFVVVWHSQSQTGTYAIFGKRFDELGNPLGTEFRVDSLTTGSRYPEVASDAAGNFCVVWRGEPTSAIFARRFSASGAPLAADFRVNEITADFINQPSVSADGAGGFVVAWPTLTGFSQSIRTIAARRISPSGTLSPEFRVNSDTTGPRGLPAVALAASGEFLVAWHDDLGAPSPGILAQRYSPSGAASGSQFRVNVQLAGVTEPAAAGLPDGRYVVAWTSAPAGPAFNVVVRQVSPSGELGPPETRVNTTSNTKDPQPAAAADAFGFVVTWMGDDGDQRGVFARRYRTARVPGDVNGDFIVDVQDVFYLINFLFAGGPAPV
jgi:hypothetical protein